MEVFYWEVLLTLIINHCSDVNKFVSHCSWHSLSVNKWVGWSCSCRDDELLEEAGEEKLCSFHYWRSLRASWRNTCQAWPECTHCFGQRHGEELYYRTSWNLFQPESTLFHLLIPSILFFQFKGFAFSSLIFILIFMNSLKAVDVAFCQGVGWV